MVQVKAKPFKVVRLVCRMWSIGLLQVLCNTVMMLIIVRLFLDKYRKGISTIQNCALRYYIVRLTFINGMYYL